ncbi:MAG: DUF3488 domain-containing transglutaminase family protein [Aquificae bacterium]|nr:DUF3488 domain-containing transglutaminase family protein [Aquificota bacterium]
MEKIKIKTVLLFITYAIAFTGFLAISRYISPEYIVIFLLLFGLGIYSDYKATYPIPRLLLNIIATGFIIYKFFTLSLEDPILPIIEALIVLLGIKLLEEKRFRDYLQIYIISVFLLTGYALVSINMIFVLYFMLLFFLITTAVVILAFYFEDPQLTIDKHILLKIFALGVSIPTIAIPIAVFLFIILPRTDYPLFTFLNHGIKGTTGFSDSVKLGEVSEIQEDSSVIMRVKMEKINNNLLYWRGIALSFFDGKEWKNIQTYEKEGIVHGTKINQEVILEPYGNRYLFALDKPVLIENKEIRALDDFTFYLPKKIKKRIKYKAVSILSESIQVDNIQRELYLQVPENIKKELQNLAKTLKKETPIKTVYAVLNFLSQNYQYSLENLPKSQNPILDFLFKTKKGNCEYFASTASILLRLNNIPTRLIAGYKGGHYNEIGKYYIIPQKNAHVWIEVYIKKHWIRFDPTPAPIEFFISKKDSIKDKIQLILDTFEYYWLSFVINFDFQKQLLLFKNIKSKLKNPKTDFNLEKKTMILFIIALILATTIILLIYKLYVYLTTPIDQKLLKHFYKKLSKLGYTKKEYEGLIDFVNKIEDRKVRNTALEFAIKFESKYYKDKTLTKEDERTLKEIISKI